MDFNTWSTHNNCTYRLSLQVPNGTMERGVELINCLITKSDRPIFVKI